MNTANQIIPQQAQPPNVMQLLQSVIDSGINEKSVEVVEKMLAMHERMKAAEAKATFNRAFSLMQRETGKISATKVIPGKDNSVRSVFAPYEEIRRIIDPIMARHGFSVSFSQAVEKDNRMTITCTLRHEDGHESSGSYTSRGVTSPGNNEAQNDGGTNKFATRMALCNVLGLVIDPNLDARVLGDTITPEEAVEVERRIRAIRKDEARVQSFLQMTGAKSFSEIKRAGFNVVTNLLDQLERAQPNKPAPKFTAPSEFDDVAAQMG